MAKAKRTGKSHVGYYAKYKSSNTHDVNARKRLTRALKRNPENLQIAEALKDIKRTRKTPLVPFWSATRVRIAGLFKEFVGKVDKDIFNTNDKISMPSLMKSGPKSTHIKSKPTDFSIKARAHNNGVFVWS